MAKGKYVTCRCRMYVLIVGGTGGWAGGLYYDNKNPFDGFFWHCFDVDATLSVIGGIKFIQYIVKLGDQSFSFSYLSRFFLYVLTIEEKRLIRTTA